MLLILAFLCSASVYLFPEAVCFLPDYLLEALTSLYNEYLFYLNIYEIEVAIPRPPVLLMTILTTVSTSRGGISVTCILPPRSLFHCHTLLPCVVYCTEFVARSLCCRVSSVT
jgi:hypothetical protein